MLKKLYEKSEIRFALAWIIAYVMLASAGDNISADLGIDKIVTLPILTAMSAVLYSFIRKNGLTEKYGLCKPQLPAAKMLCYIPLLVLLTANLWYGVAMNMSPLETALYVLSMFCVGFLEEVIFRGLLFQAMARDGVKSAVIVSSVTFGIGHIVNLFNGSGAALLPNLLQVLYAVAIGFAFVMIYCRTESLMPCIFVHCVFNGLSAFSNEAVMTPGQQIISGVLLAVIAGGYALYLALAVEGIPVEEKRINKLGFGFLRLPKKGSGFDWDTVCQMVDVFMAKGGTYFDTCYTYLNGMSEYGIKKCVAERKPRDSFQLCDKLPGYLFKSYADCQKYFDEELSRCGVEWFDVLMLHWLNDDNYAIAEEYDQFRFLREKKAEGKARRIGFSYHGDAALLDQILRDHPEVDVVLIQLNYLDWESEGIQSGKCYETCLHHRKTVMVMEPVKGGTLASIPEDAEAKLRRLHPDWTPSDWALRFAQSLPGVEIVLSGMGTVEQVQSNIQPFEPLTAKETALLAEAAQIIRGKTAIGCTGCSYCVPHCPRQIPIPQYIKLYNEIARYPGDDWKILPTYHQMGLSTSRASDCVACRACERHCPQKLTVADHMKTIAKAFEASEE